ncbi:hypothetical protein [Mycoplasmopsis lipofaciens]|uniref:hypothetical protein n=1 Tax=Mycoplasmopsis lipofaciens TaxID=114884 RepID=UPI000486B901|nr:hypothetical protein [Mycoplasmopsis lipofaciens]
MKKAKKYAKIALILAIITIVLIVIKFLSISITFYNLTTSVSNNNNSDSKVILSILPTTGLLLFFNLVLIGIIITSFVYKILTLVEISRFEELRTSFVLIIVGFFVPLCSIIGLILILKSKSNIEQNPFIPENNDITEPINIDNNIKEN